MQTIFLKRLDNRWIKGQFQPQGKGSLAPNLILVANDAISEDTMRQQLLNMAAPAEVQTRFFSIKKTIEVIHKASERQKIFLLVDNPVDALRLVEGGVPIGKLNIGNMHMEEGKKQVATAVAVNKTDVDAFKKLQELGVKLSIQSVPSTPEER